MTRGGDWRRATSPQRRRRRLRRPRGLLFWPHMTHSESTTLEWWWWWRRRSTYIYIYSRHPILLIYWIAWFKTHPRISTTDPASVTRLIRIYASFILPFVFHTHTCGYYQSIVTLISSCVCPCELTPGLLAEKIRVLWVGLVLYLYGGEKKASRFFSQQRFQLD